MRAKVKKTTQSSNRMEYFFEEKCIFSLLQSEKGAVGFNFDGFDVSGSLKADTKYSIGVGNRASCFIAIRNRSMTERKVHSPSFNAPII